MTTEKEILEIGNWFTYHPPSESQQRAYTRLRIEARSLAELIYEVVPNCADRSAAIRKLRECVMTANAAIACAPEPP